MKSKKFIRLLGCLLIVALSVAFMGCGSSGVPSDNAAGQPAPSFAIDDPDGASQAPVNSDSDVVDSSENKPANSEQTFVGSTIQSTDASNYWDGDNHFDVIGYLEANGATDIRNSLEELPIGGQTMKVYWYTTCEISDWYIEIDWISGQISVRDNCLCCFSGRGSNDYGGDRDPNSDEFVFGNENGSLMPSRWVDELPAAISHIVSATPNSATCPYCGVSTDDPVVQQWLVSESPFEHSHQPLN